MLPLFPKGGGGSSAFFKAWPPVSLLWLLMVPAGMDRSCTLALPGSTGSGAGVHGREGLSGPFLAVPQVRKGRALSLTIYSVLDKCK